MKTFRNLLAVLLLTLAPALSWAQGCTMCKTETNSGEHNRLTKYRGQGINTGILYLAAVPYLAAGALGFVWYRNRRKLLAQQQARR